MCSASRRRKQRPDRGPPKQNYEGAVCSYVGGSRTTYNSAESTGSFVGLSEPPAGSTVTAITSASEMGFVTGAVVMFPSGWKRPLGLGTSPFITQIWHVLSSGTEGMFLATRMILFLWMEATSALAP
jgi:hypothetical protein